MFFFLCIAVIHIIIVMNKRLNYTILVALFALVLQANAQTTTSENTHKGFNITANVTGGACSYLFWSDTYIQAGGGVGFRYDFNRFWGIYTSLDYENVFKPANHDSYQYLRIPVEMEFHTRHFYARGGLSFGIGLKAWTAANAKECVNIGETMLELGGRIPLTPNDILTIGASTNMSVGFDKVYHDGVANPGLSPSPPRFGACLRLGYEHRF